MKVEQIASIVNQMATNVLGADAPTVATDYSNLVDVGKQALDATDVENYVRKLVDHIGKVVFVNRPYSGRAPSVLMDAWEYGSILEKIDVVVPEAEDNPTWSLVNGQSYNQDIFNAPTALAKFYNHKDTFQIAISVAEEQVKSAFSNVTQLNAFFSMIYTKIDTYMTIRIDALIMATIDNFIANVFNDGNSAQKVNLLNLYNTQFDTSLTAVNAITNPEFVRYAAYTLKLYSTRLTNASKLFNIGKRIRHTPTDLQKIVMLDTFAEAANIYLQSDTFHNEFVKLPNADKVSYWQYTGLDYAFEDVSTVKIVPATEAGAGEETTITGILAVIFDRDALGVTNYERRVTKHYNGLGEFVNSWYKMDANYFNDFNENFVLFYIAD